MRPPDNFKTSRLSARRVQLSDLAYVASVDTDQQMIPWLTGKTSTPAESEARLRRWLDEDHHTGLGFWIFSIAGEDVGHAGLFQSKRDPGYVELGYAVLPRFWGHGYATEMAQAFLEIAETHEIERVVALTRAANAGSRRVLEKCGLRFDSDIHADGIDLVRYVYDRNGDPRTVI
jgi:RimJ/RimL family protein N-acetyltransferase